MRRQNIGSMPYLRRFQGKSSMDVYQGKRAMRLLAALMALTAVVPNGPKRFVLAAFVAVIGLIAVRLHVTQLTDVEPVDPENKDRGIASFSDGECWTQMRFRKGDISRLMDELTFPAVVVCENGTRCSGEYALCLLLFRMAYPTRLYDLQKVFAFAVAFLFDTHRDKVQGNVAWYAPRFDMYNAAIAQKVSDSPVNPANGFVPLELVEVFGFLDGSGLEIARPHGNNNAQLPFWNGYMHGSYIIFQGMSYPDGMVVIEGAFPGFYTDVVIWRDSIMRQQLEAVMVQRVANGLPRLKLYADKIYSTGSLVVAAYSLRNNRQGLQPWMVEINGIMSGIRIGVEWCFGKIVGSSKFVSFSRAMTLQKSPVNKFYHVAVLLANCHTCMYGGQHLGHFNVRPPTLNAYLSQ